MHTIEKINKSQMKKKVAAFQVGDTVKVHVRVVEGNRERTQIFQGIVIARSGAGAKETFTVRKISFGVGVERIFPVHSPRVEKVEIISRGHVRRAKLYFLRGRIGRKATRLREKYHIRVKDEEDILEESEILESEEAVIGAEADEAVNEAPQEEAPEVSEEVVAEEPAESEDEDTSSSEETEPQEQAAEVETEAEEDESASEVPGETETQTDKASESPEADTADDTSPESEEQSEDQVEDTDK